MFQLILARLSAASYLLFLGASAYAAPITPVRIAFLESFAEIETSLSDRYARQYRGAVSYALSRNEKTLRSCGIQLDVLEATFSPNDKLSAASTAQTLLKYKPWIILGPRRSDHFLTVARVLPEIPLVSYVANANEVFAQKLPTITLAPNFEAFTRGAIQEIESRQYGKNFAIAVDPTCISCRDFADAISGKLAKRKFRQSFRMEISGDQPDLSVLLQNLAQSPTDFLILPNYSSQSAHVIKAVFSRFPNIAFVGSDNWGDGQIGYFNQMGFDPATKGFCIRPAPGSETLENLYGIHQMYRMVAQKDEFVIERPGMTAYSLIYFVDRLAPYLCELKRGGKPFTAENFLAEFKKDQGKRFRLKNSIGISEFHGGKLRDKAFKFQ